MATCGAPQWLWRILPTVWDVWAWKATVARAAEVSVTLADHTHNIGLCSYQVIWSAVKVFMLRRSESLYGCGGRSAGAVGVRANRLGRVGLENNRRTGS